MVENFVGKWEVVEVLGLDDFTKAMSNPDDEILLKEKIKKDSSPGQTVPKGTVEIKVGSDGKQWKISVDMLVARGHAEEFELGVEQEHVGIGGVRVKSILSFDGTKLMEKQTRINPGDKVAQTNYVLRADGKMVMTSIAQGGRTKCVRTLKRVV